MTKLSHFDDQGNAQMVDISGKNSSVREAIAEATVEMQPLSLEMIDSGQHKKGDVLGVARIAGIQAAKKCSDLIPLCHPLALSKITIDFDLSLASSTVRVRAYCKVEGKTGVEMEALTAASVAALTIYDMCKAVDKGMQIQSVQLKQKLGGKSGAWSRE